MKLIEQVTSLELSQKLKELNVLQESLFYWLYDIESVTRKDRTLLYYGHIKGIETQYSAFSVAELGEFFPDGQIRHLPWKFNNKWYSDTFINCPCDTEVDARAKMLVYLIESNLLKL